MQLQATSNRRTEQGVVEYSADLIKMIGRVPHLDGIAQALKHKYGNEPDNHTVRILLQDVVVR
jgi:hypothetical protein